MAPLFSFWQTIKEQLQDLFINRKSLLLDGINQFITVPNFNYSGDWTISLMLNNKVTDGPIYYPIGINSNCGIFIEYGPANLWGFYDGINVRNANVELPKNKWVNISITCVSGVYSFFVNGISNGTTSGVHVDINEINIGSRSSSFGYLSGYIDKVTIWDRPLSIIELRELIVLNDLNKHSAYNSILSWYEFEDLDIDGTTLIDKKNDKDGIIYSNVTNSDFIPYPYDYQTYDGKTPYEINDGGFSWDFDGANDYITIPSNPNLDMLGAMTIVSWFSYIDSTTSNQRIISKLPSGSNYSYLLSMTSGKLCFGDDAGFKKTVNSFNTGKKICVICTHDGTNTFEGLKIYVNGIEQITTTLGTFNGFSVNTQPVQIGLGSGGATPVIVSNVLFLDRDITSIEVLEVYNGHEPRNEINESLTTNIIGSWNATNSTTGADNVIDLSGNNNHGTMMNMTDADIIYEYPRKVFDADNRGSISFTGPSESGTNNLISVGGQTEMTSSIWFKTSSTQSQKYFFSSSGVFSIRFLNAAYIGIVVVSADTGSASSLFIPPVSVGTYADSKWHNLTITYDGANIKIYYDSVLVVTTAMMGILASGTGATTIGASSLGASNTPRNLKLSNAFLSNIAITEEQIKELYNEGSGVDPKLSTFNTSIIEHWALNQSDNPSSVIYGLVNGNDLSTVNMLDSDIDINEYPTN